MATKTIGKVSLGADEVNTVKKEKEIIYENTHRLTGKEAFNLAQAVETWVYKNADPKKPEQIGNYVGVVNVDIPFVPYKREVTVRVTKIKAIIPDVILQDSDSYRYELSALYDGVILSENKERNGVNAKVRQLYERLDTEHDALLAEERRQANHDEKSMVMTSVNSIRAFLAAKR